MNHSAIRASLSAYVDGMTSDTEEIDAHLCSCIACRQEVENLRLIVNVLQHSPTAPLPRHFFIDDLQLFRYRRKQRLRTLSWTVRSIGASAAVLLIFAGGADVATQMNIPNSAIVVPSSIPAQTLSTAPLTVSTAADRTAVGDAATAPLVPSSNALNPTHSVSNQSTGLLRALELVLGAVLAGTAGAWVWLNKLARG